MMKYSYIAPFLISMILLLLKSQAQPTLTWAKQFGGTGQERGHSVAIDASGNVYTIGNFSGTADFDPGLGVFNLSATNGVVFISKLDNNGNFIWAKQLGSSTNGGGARGWSIAVDVNENVYTTGDFRGTADFDPGAGVFNLTSAGNDDIFVSKLDNNGNFVWAKRMGGVNTPNEDDKGWCITVDNNGNVYTTGDFDGTGDFDPGPGVYNLTSAGSEDIFVSKLDANGNFVWAKSMGGGGPSTANDYGRSVVVDAAGNVYVTGWFNYTADFDPGPGVYNLTSGGGPDIFVLKLDVNGNFLWVKQMGGVGSDYGESIAIDAAGNIYTTGRFSLQTDFDPGLGVYNLTSAGDLDVFVSKLDNNGDFVWAKRMGGTGRDYADYGRSIAVDAVGNVYTSGRFQNTVDFDPGVGIYNLTSAGDDDVFVSKLDANGNFLCAARMGGIGRDRAYSLVIDGNENCYVTGFFADTGDFDPGAGIYNLTAVSGFDAFIVKLDMSVCTNALIASFIPSTTTICEGDSITFTDNSAGTITSWNWTFNGGIPATANTQGAHTVTFNSSGTFNITLQVGDGITTDDTTIVITVNPTSSSTQNQTICQGDSIFLGGAWQNSAGTYIDTLFNGSSNGCDSIITTNLTITPLTTGVDIQQACDSFTWIDNVTYTSSTITPTFTITSGAANGCDSTVTLNLTISAAVTGTDVIVSCTPITWIDGNTYSVSTNTPTFTIVGGSVQGCDSIITLNLTISPATTGTDVITSCTPITWIDGNTYSASTNTPTFTIIGGAANGCDSIVTLDLTINPATTGTDVITSCSSITWIDGNTYSASTNTPIFTIIGGAANGCDSIVTLDLTITVPITTTNIFNECEGFSVTVGNNTYSTNGIFTDIINNCDTLITNLTIFPNPQLTLIKTDDNCGENNGSVTAIVQTNNPPIVYSWSTGSSDSIINNLPSGTYSLIINDAGGCGDTAQIFVDETAIDCDFFVYVPNAFTPNGDGNNDVFFVNAKGVESLSVKIYNRWGNKVFEINDVNDIWDGTYKGKKQNTAVFVYVLEATFLNGKTVTESGNVNLIR